MASLRDTVKDYQEELRDGIAWMAFWKEGRSWNAESFSLEMGDMLYPEDRSRMEEIKQIDPAAVVLNGYYCGYLGEDMNLDELTAGVRRHYENSRNDIDNFIEAHDNRLPPEVIEEAGAAAHKAGLPFSEKPYRDGENFNPYVFDGSMSYEDFELMHRMIENERSERMAETILSGYLSNLGKYTEGRPASEWVSFPTTAEHLKEVFDRIGIDGKNYGELHITEYQSSIAGLAGKLNELESLDELNYLSELLKMQFDDDREKFAAAITYGDHTKDLQDIINLAQNLDCYWLYPSVQSEEDYGHYLIEELDELELPEEAKKYFMYEEYGRDASINDGGMFTEKGYIYNNRNTFTKWYDGRDVPEEYRVTPQLPVQEKERADLDASAAIQTAATEQPPVLPIILSSEKPADKMKEITDRLEQGILGLYESDRYADYLRTMSKFHDYSLNNTILIAMQGGNLVKGYKQWEKEFDRHVKPGEKAIKILAPSPFTVKKQVEKIDPDTQKPVFDKDGKPVTEEKEIKIPAFRVVSVFDVSQTEGKELPALTYELTGNVEQYKDFFAALEKTSPFAMGFEALSGGVKGRCNYEEKRIIINEGMDELQNIKTTIHEIAHATLHDTALAMPERPDRRTREVQAESVAYAVCQHYGLDTSDYSFRYIAGWSSGKELAELKSSLETIRSTAASLIDTIDGHFAEIQKVQDKEQTTEQAQPDLTAEPTVTQEPQQQPEKSDTPAQEGAADKAATPKQAGQTADKPLTNLQKKAVEIAGQYENLPMRDKIGIIAQAFGGTEGKIETSPCTGKWRGTSDISIKFDNGVSLFIGNHRTPQTKTAKVQNEDVNSALVRYNPKIIAATKETAIAALRKREAKDNEIAAQKGLKPYTLLNVEFNDGTDERSGGHIGWYYVTLAVDDKICSHIETGLHYDILDGKVSENPTRENYFSAGALKETEVDYVFNNVGFSSTSDLYSLPVRDDVLKRAEKTLAGRKEAQPEKTAEPQTHTAEQPETTVTYYPINENTARRAKEAISFSDYKPGSATAEYRHYVDEAAALAARQKQRVDPMYHEKIDSLLDTYARKLAANMNKGYEIAGRVPSILIAGGSNFPVRKKEKQNAAADRNMEEWQDIQGLLDKIRSTGMGGISADDPQAVQKLQNKLAGLEKSQETMKAVNAYYRKHKTLDGCPHLSPENIEKLKASMENGYHLEGKPYPTWALSNNNAEIRRVKERINALSRQKEIGYVGWEFEGGKVEANTETNRLQIFFDEKPDEAAREELKSNGFRWSPKAGAWQRQLTDNAYYAANYVKAIAPLTGEKPTDLQWAHIRNQKEQTAPVQEPQKEKVEKDTFSIYQIKGGDETRDLRFEPYDRLQAAGNVVDKANYELVYTAELTPGTSLETIFTRFNIDHPKDFKGHSLSVSDIVVLHQNGQDTAHYVDSFGYKEVPEFMREQPEKANPLKHIEDTIEQNDNNFDGIINNTPTVDELEAKVKAGETISLTDLAEAVKADKERGKEAKPEKKPSIRAQLRATKEQTPKKQAKQKTQDLERS